MYFKTHHNVHKVYKKDVPPKKSSTPYYIEVNALLLASILQSPAETFAINVIADPF